jgi:hypothetical protein
MTPTARQEQLAIYAAAYDELRAALQDFPRAMWRCRPTDGWSIHEIVVHITDSEVNSYVRARRAIAEPGSVVMGYDEMVWADKLAYQEQDPDIALELFRWLRLATYQIIRDLPAATWAQTIEHTENGTMTLDDWLRDYAAHVRDHLAQMREVFVAWQAQGQ